MIKIKTANTVLYCKKWKQTVSFYRSLLNLPVLTSLDWFIEFKVSDTSRLSIADESKASIKSNEGKGITLTFEVDDIQNTHSNLVRLSLKNVVIKDHPWGAQIIHIYDPEGNGVRNSSYVVHQ